MLTATNIQCIRNENILFSNLHFKINQGEILHLKGPNGSGKTTLLRCLAGLSRPSEGDVKWMGESISQNLETFRTQVFYLAHKNAITLNLTCYENLKFSVMDTISDNDFEMALKKVGLLSKKNSLASVLSAGQKQRLALAKMTLTKALLWILDEPLNSIDVEGQALLKQLIADHVNKQGCVVLTSHVDLFFEKINCTILKL